MRARGSAACGAAGHPVASKGQGMVRLDRCETCSGTGKELGPGGTLPGSGAYTCNACGGSGTRSDAGPRVPPEPTFLDNVVAALFWAGVALVVTVVLLGLVGGWLATLRPFQATLSALLPDAWIAPTDGRGLPLGGPVAVAVPALLVAGVLTVVRRQQCRAWLADPTASMGALRWPVLGWSLLRTLVLVVGGALVVGVAFVASSSSAERAQMLASGRSLSAFHWGLVVVAVGMWTAFTVLRSLGKYLRLDDEHDPTADDVA